MKPISMIEAKKIVGAAKEDKETDVFLKKFIKLDAKKAEGIRKELENLGMIKLKEENIVKIIDLMPEDASDVNKIFSDVSLDENEINNILEIVKKYR